MNQIFTKLKIFFIGIVLFLAKWSIHAQELKYVHPNPIGDYLSSIAIVPNRDKIIALGEDTHTVIKSEDLGNNLSYEFPFHDADRSKLSDVKFIDSNIGFILKNDIIYRTEDGGQSWKFVKQGKFTWKKIEANNNGFAVAIDAFGMSYSSDFGETWSAHRNYQVDEFIADVSLLDDGKVYVAANKGLYMLSSDGGSSWTGWRFNAEPNLQSILFLDEQVGYMEGSGQFRVFTRDGGANWFNSNFEGIFTFKSMANDAEGVLWGITSDVLYNSPDSGANWIEIYDFEDHFEDPQGDNFNILLQGLTVDKNRMAVCGWSGTLLVSVDQGKSWDLKSSYISDDAIWDIHQFEQQVMTAGQDGTAMFSGDAGKSWNSAKLPVFELRYVDRFNDGTWIVAGSNAEVYRTSDFGKTWSNDIGPGGNDDVNNGAVLSDQSIIIVGENGLIWKSMDKGDTWMDITTPFTDEDADYISGIDFLDSDLGIITGSKDQVYLTHDGGLNWTDISINSDGPKTIRSVQIIDENFFVFASDNDIFHTNDAGQSYQITSSNDLTGVHIEENGNGIGQNRGEIYKTEDHGISWSLVTNKAEGKLNYGYVYNGNVWLVGFGGLIWNDREVFESSTTRIQKIENNFEEYVLYPNPSDGLINIRFTDHHLEKLRIDMFDLLGKKVYSQHHQLNSNIVQVNPGLGNGTYVLTIKDTTNRLIGRQQITIIE